MLGPVAFQEQYLRRRLWPKQQELLRLIRTHRSVAVKGCHASGKSFAVAGIVPYEILGDSEAIVLTLAPTFRQVKTHWIEIVAAIRAARLKAPEANITQWKLGPGNYAQGFSSSRGVNAQGFHGRRVLIIADEAIGISSDVWDAIDGIRAGGDVRLVTLCNPTVPSGPVFESFTRLRSTPGHATLTISAFDTPNLAGLTMETLLQLPEDQLDYAPFPQLTRRRWVLEMYHKWGPTNPRFLSRVLGEFPEQATDAVFRLEWIEAAALPYEPEDLAPHMKPGLYVQVGLDIAGPGDDETAVCARIGPYVVGTAAWVKSDPLDDVLAFLSLLRRRFPGAAIVVVGDAVGMGWHFLRALAREGFDVRAFVAGGAAVDPIMYKNSKAEAYWQLREWMRAGHVHGLDDEDTKAQLSDIRYRETAAGLIEIEGKDEARARGSSSPDRAEAAVMAYLRIVPRSQHVMISEPGQYQISPV